MKTGLSVAFVLPSFAGGGAERVVVSLVRALDRKQFEPRLFLLDASGPLCEDLPSDVPLVNLQRPRLRNALLPLAKALTDATPDIVVSTMGYLNLGVLMLSNKIPNRPKFIVREANEPETTLRALRPRLLSRFLLRRFYRRAAIVLSPSQAIRDSLQHVYRVPSERLYVLPNPIDVHAIRTAATRVQPRPDDKRRFVSAGRLEHQKGFDRLLSMFHRLPADCALDIVGTGSEIDHLQELARQFGLNDRVHFHGYVKVPWPLFAGADAFLLPSRWEGMPNAALEALACGTPVIATPEAGGITEVAGEVAAGAVTIARNGLPYIEAMQRIRANPNGTLRASLLPSRFELANVVREFERILQQIA